MTCNRYCNSGEWESIASPSYQVEWKNVESKVKVSRSLSSFEFWIRVVQNLPKEYFTFQNSNFMIGPLDYWANYCPWYPAVTGRLLTYGSRSRQFNSVFSLRVEKSGKSYIIFNSLQDFNIAELRYHIYLNWLLGNFFITFNISYIWNFYT